jgi:hypothetical protein
MRTVTNVVTQLDSVKLCLALVLGQVASQTRHEGARDARRTFCTSSLAGDRATKYGEASWPGTRLTRGEALWDHESPS